MLDTREYCLRLSEAASQENQHNLSEQWGQKCRDAVVPALHVCGLVVPADEQPLPFLKDEVARPVSIPDLVLQELGGPCEELQPYV